MIRSAEKSEFEALHQLALRSKAYWGYSQEFMDGCSHELVVPPDTAHIYVFEKNRAIAGFYSLQHIDQKQTELWLLFVEPELMRQGIGRQLFLHACELSRELGFEKLIIQSDPYAAAFYQTQGARRTGTRTSDSFPGRELPLFEYRLT